MQPLGKRSLQLRDGIIGLCENVRRLVPDVIIILCAMAALLFGMVAWLIWSLREF
jgi:hypothetical protein